MINKGKVFILLVRVVTVLAVNRGCVPTIQNSVLSFSDLIEDDEV